MMTAIKVIVAASLIATFSNGQFIDPTDKGFTSDPRNGEFVPPINLPQNFIGGKPLPTNAWWANLIHSQIDPSIDAIEGIWMNPYAFQPWNNENSTGFQVSYPAQTRVFGGESNNSNNSQFYLHPIKQELFFTSAELLDSTSTQFTVLDWDVVGVSTEIKLNDESITYEKRDMKGDKNKLQEKKITTTTVSGDSFFTVQYYNMLPIISSEFSIKLVDLKVAGKFELSLANNQTWVVYCDESLSWSLSEDTFSVVSSADMLPEKNVIRAALVPSSLDSETAYERFAGCIVKGASLARDEDSAYELKWETEGDCTNGFLHFAFEHHMNSFASPQTSLFALNSTTRGPMQAIVTNNKSWKLLELDDDRAQLNLMQFYPKEEPTREELEEHNFFQFLTEEISGPWEITANSSYYYSGKLALKFANLCLLSGTSVVKDYNSSLIDICMEKLKNEMRPFLDNEMDYPLVYDSVYRGIISPQSIIEDFYWADFGNTVYNDHHYHYGYWIMTGAIMTKLDPTWDGLARLDDLISILIRDAANHNAEDEFFPVFRHFDWFRGHSYSHGVTPFVDGKDEESTSEEMNFHHAMYLYGQVTGNKELEDLGALMMKVNARSIRLYFQFSEHSKHLHPPNVVDNKVTGIFFDNKVDYTTWFSPYKYAIHGIQMLPVSHIQRLYRTSEFIQEEWDAVLKYEDIITGLGNGTESIWQSLLLANYAVVEPEEALKHLKNVPMDDGLTRSWAIYHAMTYAKSTIDKLKQKC